MDENKVYQARAATQDFINEEMDPHYMTLEEAQEYLEGVSSDVAAALSGIRDDLRRGRK
jgi:hypothetical protein